MALSVFVCPAVARPSAISLSQAHLADIARLGVPVPAYDRSRLAPRIVHVGVGGFHRAHLALYVHELAGEGADWGIAGLCATNGLTPEENRRLFETPHIIEMVYLVLRGLQRVLGPPAGT